jgi:hypothetical protein
MAGVSPGSVEQDRALFLLYMTALNEWLRRAMRWPLFIYLEGLSFLDDIS